MSNAKLYLTPYSNYRTTEIALSLQAYVIARHVFVFVRLKYKTEAKMKLLTKGYVSLHKKGKAVPITGREVP
jgi:hypothetical protein